MSAVTLPVWAPARSLATTCAITSCFLFLGLLRCFSSAGLPLLLGDESSTHRVAPFGYLRIYSYVRIPVAFRSLSRPSSPTRA
jgi:hypothetical protein